MPKEIFNIIRKDSIDNFGAFCNIRKKTDQDIFEVFDGQERFLLNGFTELSSRIGYLGNIEDNIPFFLKACKELNIKPHDCDLKSILLINYNLIRNYFRNHILLKNIVKNNGDIDILKNIIIQHISPITKLILEEYGENMKEEIQQIEKSQDINSMVYKFEVLLHRIGKYLNSSQSKIGKINQRAHFDEFLNKTNSLHLNETKAHLDTFHMVLNEIKPIDESIESFLLYGSIARNKTKSTSDMLDGVLIIKNELIENFNDFKITLDSIVKANMSLINKSEITYKHPFHYMFEHDLSSMSPYYKTTFNNNFKPIAGKKITNIDGFLDQEYDIYFGKYAFMNTFQKLRNEGRRVLSKIDTDLDDFYRELRAFMRKGFILGALATQGIFIEEDQCIDLFKKTFPGLESGVTKILSLLEIEVGHAEIKKNIHGILDFYSATIKYVYNL